MILLHEVAARSGAPKISIFHFVRGDAFWLILSSKLVSIPLVSLYSIVPHGSPKIINNVLFNSAKHTSDSIRNDFISDTFI